MQQANKLDEAPEDSVQPASACRRKPAPEALAKLFDDWMREDDADQSETFEALRRALDEDRPEGYRLFP